MTVGGLFYFKCCNDFFFIRRPIMFQFHNISACVFSDLDETTVIKFSYKGKPAYLYIRSHDLFYNGAFGNDCKYQMNLNGEPEYIYMKNLDNQGWICLNDKYDDIYSQVSDLYDEKYEDGDDPYESLLDFAKDEFQKDDVVIYEFVELLENQLAKDVVYKDPLTWFIHSVLNISVEHTDFFENHIDFDFTILDKQYSFLQSYDYYALRQNKVLSDEVCSTLEQKDEDGKRKI